MEAGSAVQGLVFGAVASCLAEIGTGSAPRIVS